MATSSSHSSTATLKDLGTLGIVLVVIAVYLSCWNAVMLVTYVLVGADNQFDYWSSGHYGLYVSNVFTVIGDHFWWSLVHAGALLAFIFFLGWVTSPDRKKRFRG